MKRAAMAIVLLAIVAFATGRLVAPGTGYPPTWHEPLTGMAFVYVNAHTFRMGTPPGVTGREEQEVPHYVRLTKAFYIGRHEVTQREWTQVMETNPSHFSDCGGDCPVENVTFHDVEAFLKRLNARSGPGFRLPTEAGWEAACRAGGDQPYGHSSSLSSRNANINGEYPYNAPVGMSRGRTTRVGYFAANPWGLYDMSGNVWEWVQDRHCPYAKGTVTDPVGECETETRVIRGGSWAFDANSARCALRYTHRPQDKGYSLGFRLARDLW
jgi:formylglycine-generating enzyme required for sulfatase activity